MATITNKFNLPQPIVDAVKHDAYKVGGNISCTVLISAPQVRYLKNKHRGEIQEDVSEYLWSLLGSAVHHVLERANIKDHRKRAFLIVVDTLKDECKNYKSESDKEALLGLSNKLIALMVKFFPEIESRYLFEMTLQYDYKGFVLYGTFDIYDKIEKCLYDYKVCSVWAYFYPESRKKWTAQLNVYAFMLRNIGIEVNDIKIVAIFRDWSKSKSEMSSKDYPSQQIMTIPIQVIEQHKMQKYVDGKLELHLAADKGDVPECTGLERWSTASEFAIMRGGKKNAVRKFPTEALANDWLRDNKHKFADPLKLQIRPGENKNCASYCPVRTVCGQKKRMDAEYEEYISQK